MKHFSSQKIKSGVEEEGWIPSHLVHLEDTTPNPGSGSAGCGKNPPLTSGTKSITVNRKTRQYVIKIPDSGGEDVAFIDALVSTVEAGLCVNPKLRFATGFSYGGGMPYSLEYQACWNLAISVPTSHNGSLHYTSNRFCYGLHLYT
jgi:hypothetical protein